VKAWWLGLLLARAAMAEAPLDEFVPYTDGRLGGCYKTPAGKLYNCSRAPRRIDETVLAPEKPEAPAPKAEDTDAREELERMRLELEELKRRQAADDARREVERLDAERIEREARAARQRDEDAAMAAYNAIEAAKDSENLKRLEEKTEACRAQLEAQGYSIVGPGACKSPSGVYENCPDC
jgi:hypothetical protein